jgi:hypothetical protein
MLLLFFEIHSEEYDNYDILNKKFNFIKVQEEKENKDFIFYNGSQLLYSSIIIPKINNFSCNGSNYILDIELDTTNKNIQVEFNDTNYCVSKNDIIHFNGKSLIFRNNSNQIIAISFIKENIAKTFSLIEKKISFLCNSNCSEKDMINRTSGEIIFIQYTFISYNILLIGFFIILNGSIHKVLGIIFHFTLFIFFFSKDIVELCGGFNNIAYSLFIFVGSLMIGISFSIYIYSQDNKLNHYKSKVLKAAYGFLFCFFTFKSIFYYLIIFDVLNSIVYIIFLIIFTLGGIGLGLGFALFLYEKLDKYSKYLYISCSALSGSFFIVKSFGYIVGGYYSDIFTIKYNLDFDGDCKRKVLLYLFIQILLIIFSVYYQIKNEKYRDDEEKESSQGSSDLSTGPTVLSKESNLNINDDSSESINNIEDNLIINEGESADFNDINDQED